jgi:3-oxoacyl-[acyl-carrier-protein] synthase-3
MKTRAYIRSMGHAVPDRVVTNEEISQFVDTSDEWIVQRTGIRERRVAGDNESAGTLAVTAAREALAASGLSAEDIDLVVCATVSGEYVWPATACYVQDVLGIKDAGAFDLSAACAGFIYALDTVAAAVETGRARNALLIGVDVLTKQVNWSDRSTCILFGDGAGAAVISPTDTDRGLIATVLNSDGSGGKHIMIEVGGTKYPYGRPQSEGKSSCITMNGAEVYRFAVTAMGDACERVLEKAGLKPQDVDLFVPHQANLRIIDAAAKRMELPPEKVFVNVHKYGNTSGGSVPLGLYEAEKEGKLQPGMVVMTVGFGAGLVWGANLMRW